MGTITGRVTAVLVHIGYTKTGTHWLQRKLFVDENGYRCLRKRASGRFVTDRPLEFEAASVRSAFEPMLDAAEEAGVLPVVSHERLSGHPASGGHDSDRIAVRLREVFPDARVLVVVREQRSMIASSYKQYVKMGGACTIAQFVDSPKAPSARVPLFDARHFEYHHLLEHYQRIWGVDEVLALPFEQFVADGRGFVERIADFAGRPIPEDRLDRLPYSHRSNRAASALATEAVRILNHLTPRTELNPAPIVQWHAAQRLAERLRRSDLLSGRHRLRRLAQSRERDLRRTVDAWAGDRYAASNRRLGKLIGIDLAGYGWTT